MIDDEAEGSDGALSEEDDIKDNDEDQDEYEVEEPGNSQGSDWMGVRMVGDGAEDIIYKCEETGRGIRSQNLSSDLRKRLLRNIRDWNLLCTTNTVADVSQRIKLITKLKDIKIAIDEAVELDISFSTSELMTKLRQSRCHLS